MKMRTKILFVLMVAVLMGTQVMNAQNEQGKEPRRSHKRMTMEQMVERQASKIVAKLGLDDKTAARFTDVYKKYMKELDDVRKEYAPDLKVRGKVEKDKEGTDFKMKTPTDEEVDKMMRDRFKQGRKMLDVREKYYDEFRKFLSPKQVQKIYDQGQMNNGNFRREMNRRAKMNQMKMKNRGEAPQGRPFKQND